MAPLARRTQTPDMRHGWLSKKQDEDGVGREEVLRQGLGENRQCTFCMELLTHVNGYYDEDTWYWIRPLRRSLLNVFHSSSIITL